MEWEFTEGDGADGQFMPTGKVVEFLRAHLARGEIDAAVKLYESCVDGVGDQLWAEFVSASTPTKKAIANLFFRARDYKRAAEACKNLGEWSAAARSYAASYDWTNAADAFIEAGDKLKAAKAFEKAGNLRRAAELYYDAGKLEASADALEKAGDLLGAGMLIMRTEDWSRAAHLLSHVDPADPRFIQATGLLSEVLIKLNRRDLAVQRLAAALPPGTPVVDKMTAEIAYRLGRLSWEAGQVDHARQAFELVAAWDPTYKDIVTCLSSVRSGTKVVQAVTNPFIPVAATSPGSRIPAAATAPMTPPKSSSTTQPIPVQKKPPPAAPTDPFAALDGNPFAPKNPPKEVATRSSPLPPKPAETVRIGYTQRMEGYDALKALPIFEDLSLDEMKAFYTICEQVYFPAGEILIEQGHQGEGLIIIREGSCIVTKVEHGAKETTLATLSSGAYVGEMSLIDDAPTSARVRATDNVKALRIRKERFEQFLFANDRIALRVYRTFVTTLSERLRQQNARR
jgi:tetratricopeptide (TPR) repeat protein